MNRPQITPRSVTAPSGSPEREFDTDPFMSSEFEGSDPFPFPLFSSDDEARTCVPMSRWRREGRVGVCGERRGGTARNVGGVDTLLGFNSQSLNKKETLVVNTN